MLDLVAPAARQAQFGVHRLHQPQSRHRGADLRPHRRHVCGRAGGGGAHRRGLPQSAPSLYPRPARLHPGAGLRQALAAAGADPGPGAAGLDRPPGCIFSSRCSYVDPAALHHRARSRPVADARQRASSRAMRAATRELTPRQRPQASRERLRSKRDAAQDDARRRSSQQDLSPVARHLQRRARLRRQGAERHRHDRQARHDAGDRRQIGLRQIHLRQGADRDRAGDRRQGACSTASTSASTPVEKRPDEPQAQAADGLPESRQHAEPQPFRGIYRGAGAPPPEGRARPPGARARPAS